MGVLINKNKMEKFIDKLHNHYTDMGITHFIWKFGGGEPTLYKDFAKLCEYINQKENMIKYINGEQDFI